MNTRKPGFARRTPAQALPNVKSIFFNGAQGDVNHVNVPPRGRGVAELLIEESKRLLCKLK